MIIHYFYSYWRHDWNRNGSTPPPDGEHSPTTTTTTQHTMPTDTDIDPTATRPEPERTEYTDTDCTGAPVVPDLGDEATERESIAETVWSHRTTEPTDE